MSIIVIGEDNKIYGLGYSKDGHLGPNSNYEGLAKMPFGEEDDTNVDKIVDVSSGTHYTIFVTESGKLYGAGNRFLKEIGLDSDNKII
jgi:alpha-tubulin suppressor-like RCC1 family protein